MVVKLHIVGMDTHMLLHIILQKLGRINFYLKRCYYRHISYVSVSELRSASACFLNDCLWFLFRRCICDTILWKKEKIKVKVLWNERFTRYMGVSLIISCTHHFAARKLRIILKPYSAELSVRKMMHKIICVT